MKFSVKLFFLLFAFSNLILGLISGLGRIGWSVPLPETYVHHGAIMVGGFLGSLIALEKIIPLKSYGFLIGPLFSASSIIVFIVGPFQYAVAMIILASLILVFVYATYLKNQCSLYLLLAMIGAMCWFIGNVLLLWKHFYPMIFPWWMGFLLFTIVAERLELTKFLPVSQKNKNSLIALLCVFILGITLPFHGMGTYITGLSLVLISIWLMRYDVIRLTIKKSGLTRFTGIALSCGYASLLLVGVFLFALGDTAFGYDIIVHTFFLGFIFSMIFAHGPMILPGVLGLTVKPYHPLFYFPLIVLYASLFIRVAADAMLVPFVLRSVSGWISFSGILLYFVLLLINTVRALRNEKTF
ncbi:MAG: hypothetical protein KDC93_12690 [Cyclobacteriaceae bacterium]|nr:hypothetical protein [Flavobacteriaceae bacterium]MCB0493263.1 hypothetical protein [Cyclobacteriaceae bacterium]